MSAIKQLAGNNTTFRDKQKVVFLDLQRDICEVSAYEKGISISNNAEFQEYLRELPRQSKKALDYATAIALRMSNPSAALNLWGRTKPFVFIDFTSDIRTKRLGPMVLDELDCAVTVGCLDVGSNSPADDQLGFSEKVSHPKTSLNLFVAQYGGDQGPVPEEINLGWGRGRMCSLLTSTVMVIAADGQQLPNKFDEKVQN